MEKDVDGLDQDPKNLRAISIFVSYLLTCCLLTGLIIRDLLIQHRIRKNGRTSKTLPPRPTATIVSAACAIGSLGVTWYYMISFFSLSYRAWALQHSVQLPSIPKTIHEIGNSINAVHLGAWLKDVKLFKDAWEVAMETSGRLFWSSPIFFISTIWAIFVGDQARTRRIRHAWMYMLLGQIVAISFAQSLFFTAMTLYEPDKNDEKQNKPKDEKTGRPETVAFWYLLGQRLVVAIGLLPVLLISGVTNTARFLGVLAIPHLALMVPPIVCPMLRDYIPKSVNTSSFRGSINRTAYFVVILAAVWECSVIFMASKEVSPDRHLHRHSAVYVHPILGSSIGNVTTNGLVNILASLYDHPAVSSVGWDSVLSMMNYQMWTLYGHS